MSEGHWIKRHIDDERPTHKCHLPRVDSSWVTTGDIYQCDECGQQWKVIYQDDAFGGHKAWRKKMAVRKEAHSE